MSADPTRIELRTDPQARRLSGTTAYGFISFDVPYITEIVPGLWQGGCENGLVLPGFFRHLVSLYPWERYKVRHELAGSVEVRMKDGLGEDMSRITALAGWVNACRADGPVLVSCQAGLNRSSLVTATALMLEGMTADEAIALIREKRSPACLCNPAFEAWLRAGPAAPEALLADPFDVLWPHGPDGAVATRTRNALLRAGFRTVDQVTGSRAADLLDIRNFGPGQLSEVRRVLAAAGLSLAGEGRPS